MTKRILTTATLLILCTLAASAYDFMVDGLCYNRNDDGTSVTVTYQNSSTPRYTSLSGAITIPETVTNSGTTYSVTSIGNVAFYGCSGMTSVTIPNSVTSIGSDAFNDCSGLTSMTIPNSVTSILNCAFAGCSGLTSIEVESGNQTYDSRNNCNAIIETATNTLIAGCQNTTIPNSVTAIGDRAFSYCSGLTSLTIPNSVTSIGVWVFNSCSGLTSVTIPNSVTSIGERAFSGCSGLTRIDAYPNPAKVSLGSNVFYGVPTDGTLHVLPKYLEAYQTADQWKDFTNIQGDLVDGNYGDVDGNGIVDINDMNIVINAILGSDSNPAADVDGNGIVDVNDMNIVINAILGN